MTTRYQKPYIHWSKDPIRKEAALAKKKASCLLKYGVENPAQSANVKDTIKQTNLSKYGVENPFQSKEIQKKIKQTNLEKYGVENGLGEKALEKCRQTCLKKYGVENPFQSEEVKNQIKQINLKKYGVEFISQSEEIKIKKERSMMEHFGAKHHLQIKEQQEKLSNTNINKYGVKWGVQRKEIRENLVNVKQQEAKKTIAIRKLPILGLNNQKLSDTAISNVTGYSQSYISSFLRKNGYKSGSITFPEKQIIEILESEFKGLAFKIHDRQILVRENKWPLEIDIFIPSLFLGIEVNGSYWHKDDKPGRIHDKWKLAKQLSIDILNLSCDCELSTTQINIVREILNQ